MKTTIDKLLGGRFTFEQPARGHGYRVAVDTLLLAAFVNATGEQKIIELGCGVGAVMLALAVREPKLHMMGIEVQEDLAKLCQSNIERNNRVENLNVFHEHIAKLPSKFSQAYDHVMMNPPFHQDNAHISSPIPSKATAHTEKENEDVTMWIKAAHKALRPGGTMTMIHKVDRAGLIADYASQHFVQVIFKAIISKEGKDPKRILVRAIKSESNDEQTERGVITKLKPFVIYREDRRYSVESDLILRDAEAMED